MNPHNYLTDYTINDNYYNANGMPALFTALDNYASAHNWFHYHIRAIPDTNPSVYHFAVITYTDGNRPNLYTFNFKEPNNNVININLSNPNITCDSFNTTLTVTNKYNPIIKI